MKRQTLIAMSLLLAAGAGLTLAGPLNPPAGPVTSTMKTLSEVEPRTAISAANTPGDASSLFVITQPGSYFLTGNIVGVPGKNGVAIAADNVTLDLAGFSIIAPAAGATGYGVTCYGLRSNNEVHDGTARGWPSSGVNFNLVTNGIARNLRLLGNGNGMYAGVGAVVSDCTAINNSGVGFYGGARNVFQRCTADGNSTGEGFDTTENCTFLDCVLIRCSSGIYPANGAMISRCSFYDNTIGARLLSSARVTGCLFASTVQNTDGISINVGAAHDIIEDNTFSLTAAGCVGVQFGGTTHTLVRNQFSGCPTPTATPYSLDEFLGPQMHPSDMFGSTATTPLNPWANLVN
jgi:hypothetical protein